MMTPEEMRARRRAQESCMNERADAAPATSTPEKNSMRHKDNSNRQREKSTPDCAKPFSTCAGEWCILSSIGFGRGSGKLLSAFRTSLLSWTRKILAAMSSDNLTNAARAMRRRVFFLCTTIPKNSRSRCRWSPTVESGNVCSTDPRRSDVIATTPAAGSYFHVWF
jgi:hypothetical protein